MQTISAVSYKFTVYIDLVRSATLVKRSNSASSHTFMFYFLSKTVSYLLTPAGWLLGTLLLALFTRNHTRRRWGVGVALVLFWVLGNGFLTNELALWWEPEPAVLPTDTRAHNQVAVVLTGGIVNGGKRIVPQHPLLAGEADRAGQALYLYKQGLVRKILISGGLGVVMIRPDIVVDEGQSAGEFLRLAGVRPEDILYETKARNTYENALFSAPILREQLQTDRCILVTSANHMRRAEACFRKQGIQVVPYPGNFRGHTRTWSPFSWLFPSEEAFNSAHGLIREFVGMITYKLAGYC
ncbi:YdcF family protein [Nibrella saemangeumensis]|uniref:YdcF family protein n=1 Tax=Nibrella saemangeumensis TaxID=1084526 RepID=A0ABP8ND95_9BACT